MAVRAGLRSGALAFLACALLAACKGSDLTDTSPPAQPGAPPASRDAFFDGDGAAVQVVDATDGERWVYVDLDNFAIVTPADPAADAQWDIAFQRFLVKLNGGASGSGGVEVATLHDTPLAEVGEAPAGGYGTDRALADLSDDELLALGNNPFFSVCAPGFDDPEAASYCLAGGRVDRAHLAPDGAAYAFLTQGSGVVVEADGTAGDPLGGWYDYYPDLNHLLRPAGDVWVLRTTEGHDVALEMRGYYGYEEGEAEAGTVAFRFVSVTPGFTIPEPGAQQLVARASADTTRGTAPLTVAFGGDASGVEGTAAWHWRFGDGAESSGRNPTHVYEAPGTYTATLTVTDARGPAAAAEASVTIAVTAVASTPPVADAGPDQTILLGPGEHEATVTLDASGSTDADGVVVSHVWTGAPDPDDVVAPQLVLGPGAYVFTLTVTDDDLLTDEDTVTITVVAADNEPPAARIDADVLRGPAPLDVALSGLASEDPDGLIVGYEWDFGDGTPREGTAEVVHTYASPGTYTASLTVTDDGGAIATATVTIVVTLRAPVVADTFVYEFLGNQADPDGDAHGTLVWNHESNHGAKALIAFDDALATDPALTGAVFTATLWLHSTCAEGAGGFVTACPGQPDADNPYTPGVATVRTDLFLQQEPWVENGVIPWDAIAEGPADPSVTLEQVETDRWYAVDVTAFVERWVADGTTGAGIALSQELYPVLRTDDGGIPVAAFCDAESSQPECDTDALGFDPRPYIEVVIE
jgi:PKD repeat protein